MKKYVRFLVTAGILTLAMALFYVAAVAWGRMALGHAMFYLEEPLTIQEALSAAKQNKEAAAKGQEGGDGTEAFLDFCIWGQKGQVALANERLSRTVQADAILLCGNPELLFAGCRFPLPEDSGGCILDEQAAWELFGGTKAVGEELSYEGNVYTVRQVIPGREKIVAFQVSSHNGKSFGQENAGAAQLGASLQPKAAQDLPGFGEAQEGSGKGSGAYGQEKPLDRINVRKAKEESVAELERRFIGQFGFAVTILDLELLQGIGGFCVLLAPFSVCMIFFCYFVGQYQRQDKISGKAVMAGAFLAMAVFFIVLAKRWIRIPDGYIPTRWSEFQFWSGLWEKKAAALKFLLQMEKTGMDSGWMYRFLLAVSCGLLTEALLLFTARTRTGTR